MSILIIAAIFAAGSGSIVLLAVATSAARGPFAWLLRRLGAEARPSLVRISRGLYATAILVALLGVVALIWPELAGIASLATVVAITVVSAFAQALPVRTGRGT